MIGYTEYLVTQNRRKFEKTIEELNNKGVHYKVKIESSGYNGVSAGGRKLDDYDNSQIYHVFLKNPKKEKKEKEEKK